MLLSAGSSLYRLPRCYEVLVALSTGYLGAIKRCYLRSTTWCCLLSSGRLVHAANYQSATKCYFGSSISPLTQMVQCFTGSSKQQLIQVLKSDRLVALPVTNPSATKCYTCSSIQPLTQGPQSATLVALSSY